MMEQSPDLKRRNKFSFKSISQFGRPLPSREAIGSHTSCVENAIFKDLLGGFREMWRKMRKFSGTDTIHSQIPPKTLCGK